MNQFTRRTVSFYRQKLMKEEVSEEHGTEIEIRRA